MIAGVYMLESMVVVALAVVGMASLGVQSEQIVPAALGVQIAYCYGRIKDDR